MPILVALGLYLRKMSMVFIGFGLGVFVFATTAHKGPLFAPIAVVLIFLASRKPDRAPALIVAAALLAAFVTLMEPSLGISERHFGTLIFRRVLFTPAQLNYAYFDYFSENAKLFWTTTSLNIAGVSPPIDVPAPSVVGQYFFGTEVHANTGWAGAGYSHAGILGMFLYAALIGMLVSVANILAEKTTVAVALAILVTPYMTMFTSADLPTMFLTHGLLGILLVVFLLKPTVIKTSPCRAFEPRGTSLTA